MSAEHRAACDCPTCTEAAARPGMAQVTHVESAALRRLRAVPDEVTFVDEDGKDLGWGVWKLSLGERSLIAESMTRWHQSFETTAQRMIRSGLRSLQRKAVTT